MTRDIGIIDILIAGYAGVIGILSLNTAIGFWRVRNGGLLLRGLVFKLLAFSVWSVEIFASTLYLWHNRIAVSSTVQAITNLDRLTLSIPMGLLLIWILPTALTDHKK